MRWFRGQLASDRMGHAYLFEGPAGVGKKRMALALAQAVNCARGGGDACDECECCVGVSDLEHDGLLVYQDIGEGQWVSRSRAVEWAGSEDLLLPAYEALEEAGFLNPPVPTGRGQERWDRVFLSAEKLYRRSGDLSPQRVLDEVAEMGEDEVTKAASRVGIQLFRFPRSAVFFRRSLGIDLVAPRGRTDEIRTVRGFLSRKRLVGRRKIVILDDAHKMTEEAQNCLLKTLEEPPEDSLLILILDRARDVLPTIRSRCQVVRFGVVPVEDLARALEARGFDREDARWAAERSGGHFAAALSNRREEFLDAREEILHTWDEICRGEVGGLLGEADALAHEEISERGARVRRVRRQLDDLMVWLRDLLFVARGAPERIIVNADLADRLARECKRLPPAVLERVFWTVAGTGQLLDRNVDLRLALEGMVLALASAVQDRGKASF